MNEIIVGVFGLSVALITFARRYKNDDNIAGIGIAGWGLTALFILSIATVIGNNMGG